MKNVVTVDLGFGDGGKGSMVDYLCRLHNADLVVRYSGGPQSSHHVVLPDGRSHAFCQIGAGAFAGARTYLSQYMLIEPYALLNESRDLDGSKQLLALDRVSIHGGALVITPWHWMMNRLREEKREDARHGSCGFGVGEARADEIAGEDCIRARDLATITVERLKRIKDRKVDEGRALGGGPTLMSMVRERPEETADDYRYMARVLNIVEQMPETDGPVIFEGAQGVLIDEVHGWEPYNTWTDTTSRNALKLCRDTSDVEVIGIVPLVMTRHGAGPFVSETWNSPVFGHNKVNPWQGMVRVGMLDIPAIRYALRHCYVDCLALTQMDRAQSPLDVVMQYELAGYRFTDLPDMLRAEDIFACEPVIESVDLEKLEGLLGKRIDYISNGPTHLEKLKLSADKVPAVGVAR